jgi:hypothetical protein
MISGPSGPESVQAERRRDPERRQRAVLATGEFMGKWQRQGVSAGMLDTTDKSSFVLEKKAVFAGFVIPKGKQAAY